jgi:hypothetical protein
MTLSNRALACWWGCAFSLVFSVYWLSHAGLIPNIPSGFHNQVRSWAQTVSQPFVTPATNAEPSLVPLMIDTNPANARVRVMNISPRYTHGIQIGAGTIRHRGLSTRLPPPTTMGFADCIDSPVHF